MKTPFLVINPQSANGATGRRWPALSAQISRSLGDFQYAFTDYPGHGSQLAAKALREGHECVVAVGGDGTLNEVVNGFFEQGQLIHPQASLAVLPSGTGGDFRRSFDWGTRLDEHLARIKEERTRALDVGEVVLTRPDGEPAVRYFVNVASFGVSGRVATEVNSTSKILGGRLSFMIGSLRALAKYQDQRVRLSFDEKPFEELPMTTVAVANGRYFGGGMQVAPNAQVDDGWLDVTIWSGYGLTDFLFKSKAIYDGTHTQLPGTRVVRCKTLRAESDEQVLLDVDGEQPGRLPCTVKIRPAALRLRG